MTDLPEPPSDRALVVATRAGSDAAWGELRSRHRPAVAALAATGTPSVSPQAIDAVFDRLRADLVAGPLDAGGDGQPAVRGVRLMAIAALTGGTLGPDVSADEVVTPDADAIHRDQIMLAGAFARLPEAWQVVLWHRWVELAPAAEVATVLGRSPADVIALEQTADRGLFDAWNAIVLESPPLPPARCSPVIALLGGYRRGTLPVAQRRMVEAHLDGSDIVAAGGATADGGCDSCRQRLESSSRLAVLVPVALVPGLTGLSVAAYRAAIGAGGAALGSAALAQRRSERTGRLAAVGAVAGVVLALLAAAVLIRVPFGDLDSTLADFVERSAPTTTMPDSSTPTSVPSDTAPPDGELASRIELVFPEAPQGAVYVPGGRSLDLSIALSTPAPVYAAGTGTIDIGLTNNDVEVASVTFYVRTSDGIVFEALTDGVGSCRPEDDDGATCTVAITPGAQAPMSLRFAVDPGGPDRLVIDPSISSRSLEVPVETVPGLVVGEVVRGGLSTIGNSLGSCPVSDECRSGERDASSALLTLPDGAEVERALLVWEGDSDEWSRSVGLVGPETGTARPIVAGVDGLMGVVDTAFRSTADVTDVVRENGGGTYTVIRPPGTSELGDGSWTLLVVSRSPNSPRRLAVVVRPVAPATSDAPWTIEVPIAGSVEVDPTDPRMRPLTVMLHGRLDDADGSSQRVTVDGVDLGGEDPFGRARDDVSASIVVSYDREIASTEDALSFSASTTAGSVRLAAVGMALDILS